MKNKMIIFLMLIVGFKSGATDGGSLIDLIGYCSPNSDSLQSAVPNNSQFCITLQKIKSFTFKQLVYHIVV